MRKAIFTTLFTAACSFGFAGNAEVFQVNDQEIATEFAQLNELEQFVEANEGITLSAINPENPLLMNVDNSKDILGVLSSFRGDPPLGIPSFLWGFCFSVTGVALVYFIADDRDETKKALIGCAVSAGVYIIFWVVYIILLGGAFWFLG